MNKKFPQLSTMTFYNRKWLLLVKWIGIMISTKKLYFLFVNNVTKDKYRKRSLQRVLKRTCKSVYIDYNSFSLNIPSIYIIVIYSYSSLKQW